MVLSSPLYVYRLLLVRGGSSVMALNTKIARTNLSAPAHPINIMTVSLVKRGFYPVSHPMGAGLRTM